MEQGVFLLENEGESQQSWRNVLFHFFLFLFLFEIHDIGGFPLDLFSLNTHSKKAVVGAHEFGRGGGIGDGFTRIAMGISFM